MKFQVSGLLGNIGPGKKNHPYVHVESGKVHKGHYKTMKQIPMMIVGTRAPANNNPGFTP